MRILVITKSLEHGGAEKQAVNDVNFLSGRDNIVTISFCKMGPLYDLIDNSVKKYKLKSKNIILASFQLLWHLSFNKYDIIHAHMFWAERVSFLSGKLTGHKIIFNEHGLEFWRKWYNIEVFKFISIFADKIVTSCNAVKRIRIEREKVREDKLFTLYNSFEVNKGKNDKNKIFNKKPIEADFVIGYIGRFHPIKRIEIFLEIADKLKNKIKGLKIILVGDGEKREEILKMIAKRNMENYFSLPGYKLDIEEYFKIFDIFILPSKMEAFSVALLEAGAYGIPSIAFNVGGNSEIIKNNLTGYIIEDNDISSMAISAKDLYNNKKKKKEMGAAAKEYIRSKFTIEKRINCMEKIYRELN